MLLNLLLIFLEILDGIELDTNQVIKSNFGDEVHIKDIPQPVDLKSEKGEPDLVPLEFPEGFFENEGQDVILDVKKKMEDFFGKSMVEEVMKINSSDGVLDYLSKADFHSSWVNVFVNHFANKLKSQETIPLKSVTSRKKCRKACLKNQGGIIKYLKSSFERVISSMTSEDWRFEMAQDPAKCFSYAQSPETNKYECKCLDDGYSIKVSPRLLELIHRRFFEISSGETLTDRISRGATNTGPSSITDMMSLQTAKRLTLYMFGWKSKAARDVDDDLGEFLVYHGFILALLFVFCHCLFYFYLVYVALSFLNNFVF